MVKPPNSETPKISGCSGNVNERGYALVGSIRGDWCQWELPGAGGDVKKRRGPFPAYELKWNVFDMGSLGRIGEVFCSVGDKAKVPFQFSTNTPTTTDTTVTNYFPTLGSGSPRPIENKVASTLRFRQ